MNVKVYVIPPPFRKKKKTTKKKPQSVYKTIKNNEAMKKA